MLIPSSTLFRICLYNSSVQWANEHMRVTPPSPLAYCVPLYFGIAYCVPPFFGLAYCVPFNNTKQPFWAFPFT